MSRSLIRRRRIRFYSLLDTTAFDAKLVALEAALNELLEAGGVPGTKD